MVLDVYSEEVRGLTDNDSMDWAPAWSPDGNFIAFAGRRTGDWEIYTVDVETNSLSRITDSTANDVQPVWSPDGEQIAFASDRDGAYEIFTITIDTGSVSSTGQPGFPSDWITAD
jgi:TolB protein